MTRGIDDADRMIVSQLQDDGSHGLDYLADACGLSVASVQRRLKKLRQAGVIERDTVILDPTKFGLGMTLIVSVELERERIDKLDAFKRSAAIEPRVQQCYYITGEADFILICLVRDMDDFEDLTHTLFFNDSNVRRFNSSVVMDRTKVGLTIPLE